MNSPALAVAALLVPLLGGLAGMACRRYLPEHHLSRESTDVVKLAVGLMATLVALVLSLLISSASSFRGEVEREYRQALANVSQLDRRLGAYGAEARDVRNLLRSVVTGAARSRWPAEDFPASDMLDRPISAALLDLERRILGLQPAGEEQKYFREQALQLAASLVQIRDLMGHQERSNGLPVPVLVGAILCSAVIFASFGLYARPNATMVVALCLAATTVAGAVFLIVDLGTPFSGLLQFSSEPFRDTLAGLGSRS